MLFANVDWNCGFGKNTESLICDGNDGNYNHSWLLILLGNAPFFIARNLNLGKREIH